MIERPATPTSADVMHATIEQYLLELHIAFPARVQSYDASKQTADLVPLIKVPVPQPDGTLVYEDLPVLPGVPLLFPRSSRFFVAIPIAAGDSVQVLCNEAAIGHWRAGQGVETHPGDLRRHHVAHAVALPGLYPSRSALAHASASDLVLGDDTDGGLRVTIKASGEMTITQGANVRLRVEAGGLVQVGGAAGEFIALANLVNARLSTIQSAFDAHTHTGVQTGAGVSGTPPPAELIGPLASVAASNSKAT